VYEEISPAEFLERQTGVELWQLLDVREDWELRIASVAGSIDIPMREIPLRMEELDRRRGVAVLCHSGIRSAAVASYLAQAGFSPVANVTGGIDAWSSDVDDRIPRY
jgi:rhodanese-related sulfurtransferase